MQDTVESARASGFSDCLILPAMVRETVVPSCSADSHRVRNVRDSTEERLQQVIENSS